MTIEHKNFERMMLLIDEVFETRNDPNQLQVRPKDLRKLDQLHRSTLLELSNKNGPYCWVLMIPTTEKIMVDFLENRINENQILKNTMPNDEFTCIYLCSATTLKEFRGKGLTFNLCKKAIREISETYEIKNLFVWPFTSEGGNLAKKISMECNLHLFAKE